MDSATLDAIDSSGAEIHVFGLPVAPIFHMAASHADSTPAKLVCTKLAAVDTELHIPHGRTLLVRSLRWIVTTQHIVELLFGRSILKALVLDSRKILSAAAENSTSFSIRLA